MRGRRNTTRLWKFFVFGALAPAMLLAARWGRPPSMTGRDVQCDHSGKIALALITFSDALMLGIHSLVFELQTCCKNRVSRPRVALSCACFNNI